MVNLLNNKFSKNTSIALTSTSIDFLKPVLDDLDVQESFYRVKQKPGKPLFFGTLNNTEIFALPGNPSAVVMCFHVYLKPFIKEKMGIESFTKKEFGILMNEYIKKSGLTHFVKAFVENNKVYYGYIEQGVQYDDPGVTKGLWELSNKIKQNDIEENKMYYTNFELCNVEWFNSEEYMNFYNEIDKNVKKLDSMYNSVTSKIKQIQLTIQKLQVNFLLNLLHQCREWSLNKHNQNAACLRE